MDNWKLVWLTLITHNNADVGPQFVWVAYSLILQMLTLLSNIRIKSMYSRFGVAFSYNLSHKYDFSNQVKD